MMPTTPTAFFTRGELAASFSLLLSPDKAEKLAAQWFLEFADRVDASGRYVRDEPWDMGGLGQNTHPDQDTVAADMASDNLFRSFDPAAPESVFLRLGDLHLALVALVNDDLFRRMQHIRGMSDLEAGRNRMQMLRGVNAYRKRQGWPLLK